ncbi:sister chromatid cohesion 1 protein 2 [Morus notabilis]|uniref:sister chromatid cohesion 1 protein 2 n=1 Tax=Morus notabilis TaxID=981085 RepID=UPI000CED4BC2|nr:sister chromatid cohesion 1 protein 2 [Morus notabilis]
MFYSQTLLSKKGPLGAIRVAAYFFKRLKKPHVQHTDVASSVDKILQEFPVLTYRVLGYLLLGIVRIYSKKVEYLFEDCQEVLIGVNNFVVHTIEDLPLDTQRAPYFAITLPETFELDAFDLEVLDVDDAIGGNVLPHEEITLKDNAPENAGTKQYASDMCFCEEIGGSHSTCSADYFPVEGVVSSYWMDVHLSNSINIDSLIASMENLNENRPRDESVDLAVISSVEKEPQNTDKPYDEGNRDNREAVEDTQILSSRDGIQEATSTEKLQDCRENGVNLMRSSGIEEGPSDHVQPEGEDIQIDPKQIMVSESEQLEHNTYQATRQDHNLSNLQAEVEKLLDNRCSHVEARTEKLQDCGENGVHLMRSSKIEEGPTDRVQLQPEGEDIQIDPQQITNSEFEQPENEMCRVTTQDHDLQAEREKLRDTMFSQVEAIDIVVFVPKERQEHVETFDEENHDDGEQRLPEMPENIKSRSLGEGEPLFIELDRTPEIKVPDASGASTLQYMGISTPATKERSLVNARAATPKFISIPTPATKERAQISRKRKCIFDDVIVLPNKVLKTSIYDASDLVSKRRKVAQTALAVWRASRSLHNEFFEPLIPCASSELRSLFSVKKLKIITSVKTVEPPIELNIPERPPVAISEQICIAPETPVQRSTFPKSFEGPVSPQTPNYDRVRPELFENLEQEPASIRDEELDLSLIDEVTNSSVEDNYELDGWSGRTRKVARYLHRSFLDQKERGEEEAVTLSRVVKGRTKKESAGFFYEILVLSSKGYVGMKQDDAYGDILVCKLESLNMEPNLWKS